MIERICILMLINILFFLKTLGYKYTSDDIPSAQKNPVVKNKVHRMFLQIRGSYKNDPQQEHFITMIIHGLVCIFIYIGFGNNDISFLAALLFMFNPINNQGSVWISGRGYVLATLLNLMALSIPVFGPVFLFWSTYFNIGYIAPIILIGSSVWYLIIIMPLIWIYRFNKFKGDIKNKVNTEMFAEDKKIHWRKLVLGIKTFGYYISHSIIPTRTTFYHAFLQSAAGSMKNKAFTMKDRYFWIGCLSIVLIIWYWITHSWNMISFGLFWWCVGIGVFCNLMRMSQEIAERYVYLPNVGLMYVLSTIIIDNPYLVAGFIMMYATKLWFYMDAYQDDYFLIEHACLNSPDAWFSWHVRAMKRWEVQSFKEAHILWTMAKNISPVEFKLHINLATVLMISQQTEEAYKHLRIAEENIPGGQEEAAKTIIEDFRKGKLSVLL